MPREKRFCSGFTGGGAMRHQRRQGVMPNVKAAITFSPTDRAASSTYALLLLVSSLVDFEYCCLYLLSQDSYHVIKFVFRVGAEER